MAIIESEANKANCYLSCLSGLLYADYGLFLFRLTLISETTKPDQQIKEIRKKGTALLKGLQSSPVTVQEETYELTPKSNVTTPNTKLVIKSNLSLILILS